jgi:hypothetical protein
MLVAVGIAIVVVRQKSAQAANRIQELHQQNITLEQKLWAKQLDLARLREPQAIRRRAAELGFDVFPPGRTSADGL